MNNNRPSDRFYKEEAKSVRSLLAKELLAAEQLTKTSSATVEEDLNVDGLFFIILFNL